jgi:biopolymer transport protein ExbB/TolQ
MSVEVFFIVYLISFAVFSVFVLVTVIFFLLKGRYKRFKQAESDFLDFERQLQERQGKKERRYQENDE